jgi:Bacterial toxin 5
MSQSFVDEVIDTLLEEVDELARGIHGYFPFGKTVSARHRRQSPNDGQSVYRNEDLADETDTFAKYNETDLWFNNADDNDLAVNSSKQRQRTSPRSFLRDALHRISNIRHPLHFLLVARRLPNGQVTYDWRRTTRIAASGRRQTGRYDYQGHEIGPIVQVGHQGAFAAGVPERLMLEDAGLNQHSGRTIESKGAYSFKDAVMIGEVPVDVASAQQWERLGLLRRGTVARSRRIPAPMP